MIPTGTHADPLNLSPDARLFMLAWLRGALDVGGEITPAEWRRAYGRAADYQTVANARAALVGVTS